MIWSQISLSGFPEGLLWIKHKNLVKVSKRQPKENKGSLSGEGDTTSLQEWGEFIALITIMQSYNRSSAFGQQTYLLYALTCQWIWWGGGGWGNCIVKIAPGRDQMMSNYQASINLKHLPSRLLVSFASSFNDAVKFIEEIHKIFLLNHQLNFFL